MGSSRLVAGGFSMTNSDQFVVPVPNQISVSAALSSPFGFKAASPRKVPVLRTHIDHVDLCMIQLDVPKFVNVTCMVGRFLRKRPEVGLYNIAFLTPDAHAAHDAAMDLGVLSVGVVAQGRHKCNFGFLCSIADDLVEAAHGGVL